LLNVVKYWLPKRKSVNECLYLDKATFSRVREICQTHRIEFIVADMIRTAHYAEAMGVPWILNHDDLLSFRYSRGSTFASENENILGYLTGHVPSYLRPAIGRVFRMMLQRESELLARREIYWTNKAVGGSLRSLTETTSLAARTATRVFCMPPIVGVPQISANRLSDRPMSAVFTGGLNYQPNLDALKGYVQNVIPTFTQLGVEPPQLSVIGSCPESVKSRLAHPLVRFLGYVPNIDEELSKHQVFFAPIVSGSGIKTKVLEAMACGLPVIASPDAVTGIAVEHMRHCLVARDSEEFVRHYLLLNNDPVLAQAIAGAARELVMQVHSIEAATEVLGSEIACALRATASGSEQCAMSPVTPAVRGATYVDGRAGRSIP
jgi:glycosyltransferase involved in cell wall biosynthesis